MLSPRAIRLILRHFDSLDQVISKRLTRKRPWQEEALTGLFCDLLDSETQVEEQVAYPLNELHLDLGKTDEPVGIRLRLDTHQYPKHLERWVTQSDFGLIINYQNQYSSENTSSVAWLMQAKRLFPSQHGEYETESQYNSKNNLQHVRLQRLRGWACEDFIRYFLYTPRSTYLKQSVREKLSYIRTKALSDDIFDYTLGLELRDDLMSDNPTIAAGLYVAGLESMPNTLAETHGSIFSGCVPFSWFIIQHIFEGHKIIKGMSPEAQRVVAGSTYPGRLEKLVRGDHRVLEGFELPDSFASDVEPKILPAHTLIITVIVGDDRPVMA